VEKAFTKEIEEALLAGAIDLAVHSAKDMPDRITDGLTITAVLPARRSRDVFISRQTRVFCRLKVGAVVGTASLRRQARSGGYGRTSSRSFRGNVETRLRKLDRGVVDCDHARACRAQPAGVGAGRNSGFVYGRFSPGRRSGYRGARDRARRPAYEANVWPPSTPATSPSRSPQNALFSPSGRSCRTPIAGHATITTDRVRFRGFIAKPDGKHDLETEREGPTGDAQRSAMKPVMNSAPCRHRIFARNRECVCWSQRPEPAGRVRPQDCVPLP